MARRRSIYDASYQTPLADFLDQLPDYFLRYEQLKLQNKRYDNEQAYRAARDKEADRRWDITQQEKVKNKRLDTAKVALTQQLNDANRIPVKSRQDWINNIRHQYNEFPQLLAIIDSRVESLNPYVEADKNYRVLDAEVSELDTLSTDDSFGSHYNREEKRNELFNLTRDLAEGSQTKSIIDNKIEILDKTLKFEKDNAGKRKPDAKWEKEDLVEFNRASGLVDAGNKRVASITDEIREKQAKLDALGKWQDVEDLAPAIALKNEIITLNNDYYSLVTHKDNQGNIVRGSIDKNREIMKILEDKNSFPKLEGTPEILEGGVSGYEPKTEMKEQDVERYILNNPEQGFDAWMDFITNPSEESENKFSSMLNEFVEGENIPPSPPPPPPPVELPETVKGALAVIDEKRQGADLVEADDAEPVVPDKGEEVEIPAVLGGLKAGQTPKTPVDTTETPPLFPPSPPPSPPSPKDDEFAGVKELSRNKMLEKDGKYINIETVSSSISNRIKSIKSINKLYNETPPSNKKTILANQLANQQQGIKDLIEPYISNRTGNFKNKDYNKDFYKLLSKKSKMKEDELKKLILNSLEYNISN